MPIGPPPGDWSSDSDDDGEKVTGEKYLAADPVPATIENTELRPWEDAALTPFLLTENKRQQGADQAVFCDILVDVSLGKAIRDMIPERMELLKSLCKKEIPDDTYALFWSREDVAKRNEECNNRVTGPVLAELAIEFFGVGPPTAQLIGLRDAFVAELPLEVRRPPERASVNEARSQHPTRAGKGDCRQGREPPHAALESGHPQGGVPRRGWHGRRRDPRRRG